MGRFDKSLRSDSICPHAKGRLEVPRCEFEKLLWFEKRLKFGVENPAGLPTLIF